MQNLDCTIYDVILWASKIYQFIYHVTREISRKLIREWQVAYMYAVKHNRSVKSDIACYMFRSSSTILRHFKVHDLKPQWTRVKNILQFGRCHKIYSFHDVGLLWIFNSFRTFGLLLKPCHIFSINVIYLFIFCRLCFVGIVWIFIFFWRIRTCMCKRLRSLETD